MRLFKLTLSTIFRRKSWAISAFLVLVFPFVLPYLSSGAENPVLFEPALAQAAWSMAWVSTIFWGFFAAAKAGEANARSGLGEYFLTTGISASRQLLEIWAAVTTFVAPLGLAAALVCIFAASPSLADERIMWINTNLQYALLFALVVAPLIALAVAVSSRFGSLTGFLTSAGLTAYGLYGVGYMKMLLSVESSPLMTWLWSVSPHYHFADPTERLRYKLGAIDAGQFPLLVAYFVGILLLYVAVSRLLFRTKVTA
jgi:hypothetical protein